MRPLPLLAVLLCILTACDGSPTDPFGASRATISGAVTDQYGRPMTAADVSIVRHGDVIGVSNTGDSGRYSISRIRPGRYHIYVYLGRSGREYFHAELDIHAGTNQYDIVTY